MKKKISIFGSTGSIGNTTLNLLKDKGNYQLYILTANNNSKKIINLIKRFQPKIFIIFDFNTYLKIKKKFYKKNIKNLNSKDYLNYRFKKSDISIAAIPGIAGLRPTLKLLEISKKILIANKESVICGWKLIQNISKKKKVQIIPIDSEHFSIMKLLQYENIQNLEKIYLTASGGPFLNFSKSKMKNIKPKQAINHPKWKMGKKISVDSATLMNKIFEVIEAHKLFDVDLKKIEILIHPQSLVHAILKFKNGIYKFIFFKHDMSIPIGNALFGEKFKYAYNSKLNSEIASNLEFLKVKKSKFPAIKLKPILNKYSSLPIILNAANEIFVDEFLKNNISFYSIISNLFELLKDKKIVKYAIKSSSNYKSILDIDEWVRKAAMKIAKKKRLKR